MSLRIRPPINAPDEWFDKVEKVFDSKVSEAAKTAAPAPAAPGWDACTGVGTPEGVNLAATLEPGPKLQSSLQDTYGERLVKLIPSEVVGIYLVGVGVIPTAAKISVTVWAVVCLGLVVLARALGTRERNLPPEWKAVLISSISFVIWVYTIPGPFQSFGLAVPYVGSLAILVWTFVVPYFYTGA